MEIRGISMTNLTEVLDYEVLMKDGAICMQSKMEYVERALTSGYSIGVYDGDEFAGYAMIYPLSESELFLEKYFVNSKYRGKGVQYMLLDKLLEMGREGGFAKISAYVSRLNPASIKSVERVGFRSTKEILVRGRERLLFEVEL